MHAMALQEFAFWPNEQNIELWLQLIFMNVLMMSYVIVPQSFFFFYTQVLS